MILVAYKRTKWELSLIHYGSEAIARRIYQRQNRSYERVIAAHKRQKANLQRLREQLTEARFALRSELPFLQMNNFILAVSFGGDNHFVHVSQYVGQLPILGINSDPQSSTGALLYFDTDRFLTKFNALSQGTRMESSKIENRIEVEEWSGIEGEIHYPDTRAKTLIRCCVSEISIHNHFYDYISRFHLRKNREPWADIKCSGLLLACGAGSTGWYRNCFPPKARPAFPKNAPYFRAVVREVERELYKADYDLNPQIGSHDSLEVVSAMEGEITVDADPGRTYPFPAGARACFTLSKQTLRVVRDILA